MKTYVELGLAALLAVLVYERPEFLVRSANTTLGIVVMILMVGVLAKQYGLNAGVLAAIITIVLQDSYKENLSNADKASKLMIGQKMTNTIGSAMHDPCTKDKDCAPCQKSCKTATGKAGSAKSCACESTCTGGICKASCAAGECGVSSAKIPAAQALLHGSAGQERYTNIKDSLQPFPTTGTDQIGLDRTFKINALNAKNSSSQQANGHTNNGGGVAY
jgi:hypothetical protein